MNVYFNEDREETVKPATYQELRVLTNPQDVAKQKALEIINEYHSNIGEIPVTDRQIISLMFISINTGSWKILLTPVFPVSRYYEVIHIVEQPGLPSNTALHVSETGPIMIYEEGK